MRRRILLLLILFVAAPFHMIESAATQGGDCYPSSSFCCESEFSVYCSLATDGSGTTDILKKEKRTITWPIGMFSHEDVIYPSGGGKCGVIEGPCGDRSLVTCFPFFNSPLETEYNYWEQKVIDRIAAPHTCLVICGGHFTTYQCPRCEEPAYFSTNTFSVNGPCGGGGGGGDDGGGGWEGCFCYRDTDCDFCVPDGAYCQGHQCWGYTPIVVDVNGDGYRMTDAARGVAFDFRGAGFRESLSWTAARSDDAWLALDRNGNGVVDSGTELFGSPTPQTRVEGVLPNGFIALAEYDQPSAGGNADGVIDRSDAIFTSLLLWQDTNHNGASEPSELRSLAALGLASIDLDYRESKRVDQYGNRFRYRSKVKDSHGAHLGRWAWDVFLVVRR